MNLSPSTPPELRSSSWFPNPRLFSLFTLCVALVFCVTTAGAAAQPGPGDSMPELRIVAPSLPQDREYLGVGGEGSFSPADIQAEVLIFELVGVYCPFCHKQAPLFNSLFKRLQRAGLGEKVKMLAVASGASELEVAQLLKHSAYAYPVVRDEDYSVHKALGEPKTPFTLVVKKDGSIVYAHLGVTEDVDALFDLVRGLVQ